MKPKALTYRYLVEWGRFHNKVVEIIVPDNFSRTEVEQTAIQSVFDESGIPRAGTVVTVSEITDSQTYMVDVLFNLKRVRV